MAKPRDYKNCIVCGTNYLPTQDKQRFCQRSCKGKFKYITNDVTTESQYEKISGDWRKYCQRLLYSDGRRRDGLTIDMLLDLLEKQDYLCALTGITLTCQLEKGVNFATNVSVDRIEAGGPYVSENIQLVCKAVNKFRGDLSIVEFKWWCKKVVNHGS